MSITYNKKIPTEGLIFAVDAGNKRSYPQSGTKLYDISGNIVDNRKVELNIDGFNSPAVWSDYKGGAFYFNDQTSKSFIKIDDTQSTSGYNNDIKDLTIIAWVEPEMAPNNRMYFLDTRVDSPSVGCGMGFDTNGTSLDPFHFFSTSNAGYDEVNSGNFLYQTGTAQMHGIRRSGADLEILSTDNYSWVTNSQSSDSGGEEYTNLSGIILGTYRGSGASTTNYWYKGYIFNVMIWNRPLTDKETMQLYSAFREKYGAQ